MPSEPGEKERKKALLVIHAVFPFVVQACVDGILWETVDVLKGKTLAYARMEELRKKTQVH